VKTSQGHEGAKHSTDVTRSVFPDEEWWECLSDEVEDTERDILLAIERYGTIVPNFPEFIDYESAISPAPEWAKRLKRRERAAEVRELRKDKQPNYAERAADIRDRRIAKTFNDTRQTFMYELAHLNRDDLIKRANWIAHNISSLCKKKGDWPRRKRFAVYATKTAFEELCWLARYGNFTSWVVAFDKSLLILGGALIISSKNTIQRKCSPMVIIGHQPSTAVLTLETDGFVLPQDCEIDLGVI
jgi:hypothetical protein